eukprot:365041-Chlamydomonas_euryale.AAC.8
MAGYLADELFVSGIASSAAEADVKALFEEHGAVCGTCMHCFAVACPDGMHAGVHAGVQGIHRIHGTRGADYGNA